MGKQSIETKQHMKLMRHQLRNNGGHHLWWRPSAALGSPALLRRCAAAPLRHCAAAPLRCCAAAPLRQVR
jgi:hypothetical protein